MHPRAGQGPVGVQDGHQVQMHRAHILHRSGRPNHHRFRAGPAVNPLRVVSARLGQADRHRGQPPGPLGDPLRPGALDAEGVPAAVGAPAPGPAHPAGDDPTLEHEGPPARRARRGISTGAARASHPVPGAGHDQRPGSGLLDQTGQTTGPVLGFGRDRLHQGGPASLHRSGRPPNGGGPPAHGVRRLHRRGERRHHTGRPFQCRPGRGHLPHVVVGGAILPMARVNLPADPDQPRVPEGGEHGRAGAHHDPGLITSELQPRSIPHSTLPTEVPDRFRAERPQDGLGHIRKGLRLRHQDDGLPAGIDAGPDGPQAFIGLLAGQRPDPRDHSRLVGNRPASDRPPGPPCLPGPHDALVLGGHPRRMGAFDHRGQRSDVPL
jgi:hypothetical protein